MKTPLDLVKELGEEEAKITKGKIEFISPVFNNVLIASSVKGLVYTFTIPKTDPGWWLFKATNYERAKAVREAYPDEIESYFKNLPSLRLVTSHKVKNVYYALPQKGNKLNLSYENPVPVYLVDDTIMDFDMIIGRFDGSNIWFESHDYRTDPTISNYLRDSYQKLVSPKTIRISGLTLVEKTAYTFRFAADKEIKKQMQKKGLEKAVLHAGGNLISYSERSDSFSVTYTVDGHHYTSYVTKDPSYSVITAGICLSGQDRDFDLASLVSVMRQGQHQGEI